MKNIIVTGTSRGIGKELCLYFANLGHRVLALSRTANAELTAHSNVEQLALDLGDASQLSIVTGYINTTFQGKLDILVHNAGALINKPFEALTTEDFEYVYRINVFAVAALTQACLPFLVKGSHVLTVSSMGGIQGSMKFPGLAAYSSSKGAVITLSELLAEEYKLQGISFNVVALGAVQTEMLQEAFPGFEAPISALGMAEYLGDLALNGTKFFNGKVIQVSSTTP